MKKKKKQAYKNEKRHIKNNMKTTNILKHYKKSMKNLSKPI